MDLNNLCGQDYMFHFKMTCKAPWKAVEVMYLSLISWYFSRYGGQVINMLQAGCKYLRYILKTQLHSGASSSHHHVLITYMTGSSKLINVKSIHLKSHGVDQVTFGCVLLKLQWSFQVTSKSPGSQPKYCFWHKLTTVKFGCTAGGD